MFIVVLLFWYDLRLIAVLGSILVMLSLIVFVQRGREDYEITSFQFKKNNVEGETANAPDYLIGLKVIASIITFFVFPLLFPFVIIFSSWGREKLFDKEVKSNNIVNFLLSCIFLLIIYLIGTMYFVFTIAFVALLAIILHFKVHYDGGMILRVITVVLSVILLLLAVFVYIIFSLWFMPR